MGNVGFQELLVIAVLALLVFGPDRLPELARQAGRALARVREETSRSVTELKQAADLEDLNRELRGVRAELRAAGRDLTGLDRPAGTRRVESPPPTDPDAT
ncbi:MAG: Sec-independent protein translocase protein TatB [Actinobacteria bacterium]|nr:Sec-independent protein translocase protein TatB [Actinomycetota bacterium]